MQGDAFNRNVGSGAFNSAFASNNPQPFNQPYNEPGSATFGQNQQYQSAFSRQRKPVFAQSAGLLDRAIDGSLHTSPFNAAEKKDTPFWNPKAANNNLFDQALAGPTQPHNSPFAQNQSIPFTQNQSSPFAQNHSSPFAQSQSSPFAQNQSSPFAQNHSSSFSKTPNTQSNRPSPFDQSITSANKSVFNSTDVKPAHIKAPIITSAKPRVRRLSAPYERPAKAPVNKRLGKAVEDKQPTPARVQPKVKELGTKPQPPSMPNKTTASLFLANDPGRGTAEKRAVRFGAYQVLYQEFKERRVIERKQAIRDGLIPNPDEQTSLEDAIDFRGSCILKCPEFEMLERDMQNDLDDLEKDTEGNIDPDKAVKKYRRSAAGGEQPLPSDVRTPATLNKTLDYLVDEILANNPIDKCHKFLRDRTRSIRQDFTLQNIRDLDAVATHERIARFHILSLHEMCEYDESTFSLPQEMEQLHKTLISLMEFYDDLRDEGIETNNEAEFRAYHIISQIKDEDIAQRSMRLPVHIFKSQYVTRALEFRALSQRNNEILETSSRRNKPENIEACQNFYSYFFKLIADPTTPYLMACLLETHFSEVRKGALKAMNTSYMMKAGGVPAEHVRQVLAYDTMKQLFKEAMLYGIVIDNSLGEPTLSFGQKHYSEKFFVFKEPLSNPSQRKSLLLVEPKKAGRTFRDIVNGINPHVTPLPNQNVFATQVNPLNPQAIANADATPVLNYKLSELTDPDDQQKEKEKQYSEIRNQAALANELAAQERKKLELLMIKKKQQEEQVRTEALLAEAEVKRKERLIREEIRRKQEMEQERNREAQKQEALLKEQREKRMASMRLEVLRSQARKRLFDQIIAQVIREESRVIAIKNIRKRRFAKKIGLPWLERARNDIIKRESLAKKNKQIWHFNMFMVTHNPYIPSDDSIYKSIPEHATPQGIHKRTTQSIQAEKIALEDIDPITSESSIWKAEDFSKNIYPRIRDKMMEKNELEGSKRTWRLLINAPDTESDSAIWFRRKFGLDDLFFRNDALYQAFDVKIQLITPDTKIACDHSYQTGAVIFSLPESKNDKSPIESLKYWSDNKKRLDRLVQSLHQYNPGLKVPVLFTYFPDSSLTESTIEKIPKYLGLETNHLISDYHVLVMNPLTISKRINEEVNWLSRSLAICK
ncbi:SAC3/GANP/Nin1/mts3/eIF-3 p25 family-domain-containing protein [Helicostylum pulchrum]|nr:SAC3/GANP/Nin1/mts3/eIF-3 p25 family-domain-containing protein [Helicostylum pulchrum]